MNIGISVVAGSRPARRFLYQIAIAKARSRAGKPAPALAGALPLDGKFKRPGHSVLIAL
jgi:hypothetical protein